ncbi:hypothetical protein C8J57DRAFT_1594249 [Mycena rebaudengoi]|nr:hypothetical protein C8J57DRAFT_1594249 [Mycena rebaudengoi]
MNPLTSWAPVPIALPSSLALDVDYPAARYISIIPLLTRDLRWQSSAQSPEIALHHPLKLYDIYPTQLRTSPNTLAFRNGSAPRYISVRSGTFRSRAPEHLPTCRQLVLPVPRTALRTTLRTAPNLPCAPAHRPAHLRPTSLRTCAAQLPALALRIPQTLSPRTALRRCAEPPAHLHPTSLRTCAQLPCAPALNPCTPALRNFPDRSSASFADLPTTPPTRTLRPLSRTCPEHMRPTHPAAIPHAPPAHSTARPASCVTGPPRTSPRPLTARQLPHAAAPFHTPTP